MLKLPLRFATEKDARAGDSPEKARETFVFSELKKLMAFLQFSHSTSFDVVTAVDRQGLIVVIADVHMRGGDAVYLHPDSDGYGGELVPLTDLMLVE